MGARSRYLRLFSEAAPPFLSQIGYSAASLFAISGLARQCAPEEIATVLAAYSIESIAVSWGNARWVGLLVSREAAEPRRGDVDVMARAHQSLAFTSAPLLFAAAFLVDRSFTLSLAAAFWAVAMLFGDLWRYAASRYLGHAPVLVISGSYALISIALSFRGAEPVSYLGVLGVLAALHGIAYWWWWRRHTPPGLSTVWTEDRAYGRAGGWESLLSSSAAGLSGVAVSALNPVLAVGLQLGNQLLTMPSIMIVQAFALPLMKRSVRTLSTGRYPRTLVLRWMALATVVPPIGVIGLIVVRPWIERLMGASSQHAYFFLPAVLVQTLIIVCWQAAIGPRRWTHGPISTSQHVAVTYALTYAGLVALAATTADLLTLRRCLLAFLCLVLASTVSRAFFWVAQGRNWSGKDRRQEHG